MNREEYTFILDSIAELKTEVDLLRRENEMLNDSILRNEANNARSLNLLRKQLYELIMIPNVSTPMHGSDTKRQLQTYTKYKSTEQLIWDLSRINPDFNLISNGVKSGKISLELLYYRLNELTCSSGSSIENQKRYCDIIERLISEYECPSNIYEYVYPNQALDNALICGQLIWADCILRHGGKLDSEIDYKQEHVKFLNSTNASNPKFKPVFTKQEVFDFIDSIQS